MLPFDNAVEDAEKLISQGLLDAAIVHLREVIQQVPSHTTAHVSLANAFRGKSEFEQAMDVLHDLVAIRPDCRDGHYGLGLMLLERDRLADAIF